MTHNWSVFPPDGAPRRERSALWPPAPPWRHAHEIPDDELLSMDESSPTRGEGFIADESVVRLVNAAIHLRRPLLVTGEPGSGKSSLAYAIAWRLQLGPVLTWAINTRATLQQGLYTYDALGRLNQSSLDPKESKGAATNIADYLLLGPIGAALLPWKRPRVLLIDEIDKSDIDLPNDLLNVFEEGEFEIPELRRIRDDRARMACVKGRDAPVAIPSGRVRCREFPIVVLTSNDEREFPAAFLRRCVQLRMPAHTTERLTEIVSKRLGPAIAKQSGELIDEFFRLSSAGRLATDQLLNALFAITGREDVTDVERKRIIQLLLTPIAQSTGAP